jgi:hypothetical protein
MVEHIARPMGRANENGPHLRDLRDFVAACDGMDDNLLVRIEPGHLDEGGRRNVTISTRKRTSDEPNPLTPETPSEDRP